MNFRRKRTVRKAIIIVAGGSGSRMKSDIPKQFLLLLGKPVLIHTLEKFALFDASLEVVLVLPENESGRWEEIKHTYGSGGFDVKLAAGGQTRFDSVKNGLACVESEIVGVHDAVRPLVSLETIALAFGAAVSQGAGIPVVSLNDSIRRVDNGASITANRDEFRLVQTPQCFRTSLLKSAYAQKYQPHFTDDASVVEATGATVTLTEGNRENIKLTTPSDMVVAEALMRMNQ